MIRICLTGPECSGKTTLAALLAEEHGTAWSAEYAREYAQRVKRELTADDVEPIAAGQIVNEEQSAAAAEGLLFLDTDLVSTVVYARHYYGACPRWIEEEARRRRADLYLLCDPSLPWVADGVRDSPGALRDELFASFQRTLGEFGASFVIVRGAWEERVGKAREAVEGEGWDGD